MILSQPRGEEGVIDSVPSPKGLFTAPPAPVSPAPVSPAPVSPGADGQPPTAVAAGQAPAAGAVRPLCLIVTNNFPPSIGGAANVYAALATAAQGRIAVLAAARDYLTGRDLLGLRSHDDHAPYPLERIRDIRPPLQPPPGLRARLFARAVEQPALRRALWGRVRAIAKRTGVRVICLADDETVGWMLRPAQAMGLAVILYVHGDDLAARPGPAAARLDRLRRRQFRRADAIVTVSEAAARDLCGRFDVPRDRVDVVPNGIDPKVFRPQPPDAALLRRYGLSGRRVIVTVARLVARKGVDTVIRALPSLAATIPDIAYLVVGDGAERASLQALAADLRVGHRVIFAGAVPLPRVAAHLALGDVFAMPNRRLQDGEDEGFGLVFLEANAVGLPVLGGRAGGVPEVVRDGQTGLLVDGHDLSAVTEALRALLTDQALRQRLASAGLAAAAAANWSNRTAMFLAVCERIARQS